MNFYKHHLGDYDGATAHLSWDEDMAYTRLLRAYYRREKPIPDADKYRLVRAQSKLQRIAVDAVLGEFFELRSDGWHNKRADEEITKYREEGADSEAKKENERERQRRYRERRKQLFDALREHGIVPKWDTPLEQLEADLSREQQRTGNAPVTRTDTANQNQEPEPLTRTKNQEPEKPNPIPPTAAQAPDPIFGVCLDFLKAKGVEDKSARSVLGLWRKNHGEEVTFATVEAARREDVSEPVAWITKALQAQGKPGKVKHGNFGQQNYRAGVGVDGSF